MQPLNFTCSVWPPMHSMLADSAPGRTAPGSPCSPAGPAVSPDISELCMTATVKCMCWELLSLPVPASGAALARYCEALACGPHASKHSHSNLIAVPTNGK